MSINNDYEDRIKKLNNKFDNLVSLVDKKPNFYNNIFFEVNSKPIPLNLINTDYINTINNKEKTNNKYIIKEEKEENNSNYYLKDPLFIFSLPSSDDSDSDQKIEFRESKFKSICNEIVDTDFLKIIDINNIDKDQEEKLEKILKKIYPILMFKNIPELSSINDLLKVFSNKIRIKPYEIKKVFLPSLKNYIFLVKFFSFDEAKKAQFLLNNEYNINFHLCYDKRELKDSKWYCVIFRRECNKDKTNYKFNDIINDIFEEINCEKKIITMDENIFKKNGNIFYSAIKVDNLNDALNLCIKYNGYNNLKVHLHYLTYKNSKKIFPNVLTQKHLLKKKSTFDKDSDSKFYNKLFGQFFHKKKYKKDY